MGVPRWPPFFQNNLSTLKKFPESFVKIGCDLAAIFMELKKLDWCDGGGKGRREGKEEREGGKGGREGKEGREGGKEPSSFVIGK